MPDLTALVGLHHKRLFGTVVEERFKEAGCKVTRVYSFPAMTQHAKQRQYSFYLMDLNLGSPMSVDTTPAGFVYRSIKDRVDSGEAKFLGVSGTEDAVKIAAKLGIPAIDKADSAALDEWFREIL